MTPTVLSLYEARLHGRCIHQVQSKKADSADGGLPSEICWFRNSHLIISTATIQMHSQQIRFLHYSRSFSSHLQSVPNILGASPLDIFYPLLSQCRLFRENIIKLSVFPWIIKPCGDATCNTTISSFQKRLFIPSQVVRHLGSGGIHCGNDIAGMTTFCLGKGALERFQVWAITKSSHSHLPEKSSSSDRRNAVIHAFKEGARRRQWFSQPICGIAVYYLVNTPFFSWTELQVLSDFLLCNAINHYNDLRHLRPFDSQPESTVRLRR